MNNLSFIFLCLFCVCYTNALFALEQNSAQENNLLLKNKNHHILNIEKIISNGFQTPQNIVEINTTDDDFAPYFFQNKNEMLFNSNTKGYSRFYVSKINDSQNFLQPKLLNSTLNEGKQNRTYFSMIDEKQAFVCAFNHTEIGSFLNIQKSIFARNTWSAATPMLEFTDSCFIAHPSVSPNGELLIFASNKNESTKTTDLWSATKQPDGSWNMLISLDELNSNRNEITPCFVTDNLLIFASDGFEGPGGFDLYYSFLINGKWYKPQPLEGINTEFNESDPAIYFDSINNEYILVFASDRPGGRGKLDLYSAKIISKFSELEEKIPFYISATTLNIDILQKIEYDLVADTNISYSTETISVEPPMSQFFVKFDKNFLNDSNLNKNNNLNNNNINPNDLIWNYAVSILGEHWSSGNIANDELNFILSFDNIPVEILLEADSMVVTIYLLNSDNVVINSQSLVLEIKRNTTRELKKHTIGNGYYYKMFAFEAEDFKSFKEKNSKILAQMQELVMSSKKTNIYLYNDKFKNELTKFFNSKKNINFIKNDNDNKFIELQMFR